MSISEKRYQLAAHKRNVSDQKLNYYSQTAQYFERESQKAKQFNTWNVEVKSVRWENIKKAETLKTRRNKLQVLLRNEEQAYKRECDQLKARKITREEIPLEVLREKLNEKRAELSLYNPNTFRRLKSYFTNPAETERVDSIQQNFAEPITRNLSRLSFGNSGYLNKRRSYSPFKNNRKSIVMDYSNEENEKAFDERTMAYNKNRTDSFNDHMDYSDNRAAFVPDRKYSERYAHRSLENTNVFDTAGHTNDVYEQHDSNEGMPVTENPDEQLFEKSDYEPQEGHDSVDSASGENGDNQDQEKQDDHENSFHHQPSNLNEEFNDSKDFMPDFPKQDKLAETSIDNSSEMMVLYLIHNELGKRIQELETKEHRACMKHLWEETLRLRDMRNRLELLREKKIYQRDDLHIDPAQKEMVLKNIEKRAIQLKARENTCADSKMYSEDAKRIWNKWVEEDKNSPITEGDDLREALMNQLGHEWQLLGEQDKKILTQTYADVVSDASLQEELQLLAKKGFH